MREKKYKLLLRPQIILASVSVAVFGLALAYYPIGSVAASQVRNLVAPGRESDSRIPIIGQPFDEDSPGNGAKGHQLARPDSKQKPMLALSFDDGPNPLTTPLILNALEKEKVQASFFIVGSRVKGSESILRRMYRDGYDIGNHSWNHPDFIHLNERQISHQIDSTEKVIAAAGVPAPYMFRPPYGDMGDHFPKHLPLAVILWNIDPRDWADRDPGTITKRIISEARPGGIIDMHGIYLSTAQAIVPAIQELKKHYQLVTVSKLLGIKPGSTGIYYGTK